MKKLFLSLCCAALALSVCSCIYVDDDFEDEKVALILPSGETVSRWAVDAHYLTEALKNYGCDVRLFTAEENEQGAAQQVKQLEEAVLKGYKNIVITPVDYNVINKSGILEAHQDCNFICYDRMIMDNPAVDFYTTCNPAKIGEMQAQFLLEKVGDEGATIELFAGPKTDKNAVTYFESACRLLDKAGSKLSVPSKKTSYDAAALDSWSSEDAKAAMLERLEQTNVVPDLVLAPNDNVADGVIKALEAYQPGIKVFPVITGQDLTDEAKANIKAGKQAMSIYKEYEDLAETTAMVVNCFISGKPVITGSSFDNGKIRVPTKYTSFTLVTIHNIDD